MLNFKVHNCLLFRFQIIPERPAPDGDQAELIPDGFRRRVVQGLVRHLELPDDILESGFLTRDVFDLAPEADDIALQQLDVEVQFLTFDLGQVGEVAQVSL